ncbi:MAG: endonuclease domain-containing protein [Proteobacteria bacterium]|nr:endonuclease domain-containing protein [Pseudomonadota bacterium]
MSIERAHKLRRNATAAETRPWRRLRRNQLDGHHFRRQVPIAHYYADFVCVAKGLIVEVDGGQHAERQTEDAIRTERLEAEGYRVLRFWNNDVLTNTDGVVEAIRIALAEA